MRTSYNTYPFHTSEVLKNYIITSPNVRVRNNKQQNEDKHREKQLSIVNKDSVYAHQKNPSHNGTPHASLATGVNKP